MRWITHQTGATLGAAALGLPLAGIAAALLGAIWPDVVDRRLSALSPRRQRTFNRIHRGFSHWFGWYALLLLALCAWPLPPLARAIALGFALGALSHVALDLLTPQGIPLLPFSRKGRVAAPLCVTGHWSEYIFLATMVIGGAIYLASQNGLWLHWL